MFFQFQSGMLGIEQLKRKVQLWLEPRKVNARLWAMVIHSHGASSCQAVVLAVIAYASLVVGIQQEGGDCLLYREETEHKEAP